MSVVDRMDEPCSKKSKTEKYYAVYCPCCNSCLRTFDEEEKNLHMTKLGDERELLPDFCTKCKACLNVTVEQPDRGNKFVVRGRADYLRDNDFFMALAFLYAAEKSDDLQQRSHDRPPHMGYCLIKSEEKFLKVVSAGANEILDENSKLNKELKLMKNKRECTLFLTFTPADNNIQYLESFCCLTEIVYMPHEEMSNSSNKLSNLKITKFIPRRISRIVIKPQESHKLRKVPDYKVPYADNELVEKWEDDKFFIAMSYLVGMRSDDPSKQVGSCITNENGDIVSLGYNHYERIGQSFKREGDVKLNSIKFAEVDAIDKADCGSMNLQNSSIYTTIFPGGKSPRAIKDAGITNVIYTPTGKLLQGCSNYPDLSIETFDDLSSGPAVSVRPFMHGGKVLATIDFYANFYGKVLKPNEES